jgi:hypothetical protein
MAKDSERDAAAISDASARVEHLIDQGVEPQEAQAAGRAYIIERSTVNNYLPKGIKAELEISPTHPNFSQAVSLYEQFEAERPDWVADHIDSNTVREIRSYQRHLQQTGSEEEALARINASDEKLYKALEPKVIAEASDAIVEDLRDGIFLTHNGINDSDRLRLLIKGDFKYYVEQGLGTESAMAQTINNIKGRYTAVGGEMYLNNEGWGQNADKALEAALKVYAKENEAVGFFGGADLDSVSARPVPNKPGMIRLSLKGSLMSLGSMTDVSIKDVMSSYTDGAKATAVKAAAKSQDAKHLKVERLAKEALTPIPASISSGKSTNAYIQMLEVRESKWASLTNEQRDAHMQRQRR